MDQSAALALLDDSIVSSYYSKVNHESHNDCKIDNTTICSAIITTTTRGATIGLLRCATGVFALTPGRHRVTLARLRPVAVMRPDRRLSADYSGAQCHFQ